MRSCQDTPPGVLTEEQEFARYMIFPVPSLPHPLNPFVQTQAWELLGFFFSSPKETLALLLGVRRQSDVGSSSTSYQ